MSFADGLAHLPVLSMFVRDRDTLPDRADLPRYLAPVPKALEDFGLRLVWLVVAINLAGTAFGFWYYRFQFGDTPVVMWPFVPDSPGGTLFIALAMAAWAAGRPNEYLNAFALFGCIKLGAWTPFVLLAFFPHWDYLHPAMYNFLFWSHWAMVLEAFVLHRIADFPPRAIAVAAAWYGVDLVFDYVYTPTGPVTHTSLPVRDATTWFLYDGLTALQVAGAGAAALFAVALLVGLGTHRAKRKAGALGD